MQYIFDKYIDKYIKTLIFLNQDKPQNTSNLKYKHQNTNISEATLSWFPSATAIHLLAVSCVSCPSDLMSPSETAQHVTWQPHCQFFYIYCSFFCRLFNLPPFWCLNVIKTSTWESFWRSTKGEIDLWSDT